MKIAFVYFPNFTLLDVIGVYDPLYRLKSLGIIPGLVIENVAFHPECQDPHCWSPPNLLLRKSLSEYDLLFVPGGMGTRPLRYDQDFLDWLRTGKDIPLITSVCTGSLLLGAAGMLRGHAATTHFNEYDSLKEFCLDVKVAELVVSSNVITAGAVAASLELGLYLCERLAGKDAREKVRKSMNYRNDPMKQ